MSSVSWTRVNDLFLKAAALPADERAEFLSEACAGDVELGAEVERLLAGDVGSANASFLDPITEQSLDGLADSAANGAAKQDAFLGQRVGLYEIKSLIGVGGMGRVYLAERREGFAQQVAIKLLKRGMDSDELLRRFQNEIQILAELGKHPNIAALMDAGLTDSEQPYLVMDYVDGEQIDKYCGRQDLTVAQRLDLFLGICDAVQFAHQRTVIHRDLKPSNVLVTADGQPKLIDFGIAKLTRSGGDVRNAIATRTAMRMFTPNYASPEQAAGGQLTTASDVYSLGVLLYELLTGRRPYEIAANSESAAQAIVAAQPPRPSAALTSVEAKQLRLRARELVGDLDNIIQMAMRKEPERRYATVAELAEDIRRHLTQFPVVARPETIVYHCSRFLRRHRVAAAAALLILTSLSAGIFGTGWQWIRAEREARAAVLATEQAEQAAEQAQEQQRAALWQVYRANIALTAADLERNNLASARRRLDACPIPLRNWEWRYFNQEVRKRHVALTGHTQPASSMVFYRDGSRLLTSSPDGTLRTWNIASGKQLSEHRDDRGAVEIKSCSGGGRFVAIVASSASTSIATWDVEAGQVVAEIPVDASTIDVGGLGTLLATASTADERVRLWNMQDGTLIATLPELTDTKHVAVSQDGSRIAYSRGSTVVLWDVSLKKQVALLKRHKHAITALAFSGNSKRLLTACHYRNEKGRFQSQLSVWDARDGSQVVEVSEFPDALWSAKLNHKGDRIATTTSGSIMRLRDGVTGEVIKVLEGHHNNITEMEFSPDDKYFASSAADYTVRLWNGQNGELLTPYSGPARLVSVVQFGPDSKQLATCGTDGSIRVWNIGPTEHSVLRGHEGYIYSARWLSGGKKVVSGSWDGSVRIWDVDARAEQSRVDVERVFPFPSTDISRHPSRVLAVSASLDASRVAAVVGDGTLQVWRLDREGRVVHGSRRVFPSRRQETWRTAIAFVPDSKRIVVQRNNNEVILWNTDDDSLEAVCKLDAGLLQCIAVRSCLHTERTASSTTLALGFSSGEVQIWQQGAARALASFRHSESVNALAYSNDCRLLASGGDGRVVKVWDVGSGASVAELLLSSRIHAIAFTPDGTRLAAGTADREILIWDTASWSVVAQLAGHEQYVHSLEFSTDGTQLLSGSGDKTVRIWDTTPAN